MSSDLAQVADAIAVLAKHLQSTGQSQAIVFSSGSCTFKLKAKTDGFNESFGVPGKVDQGWVSLGNFSVLEGDR